MHKQNLSVSQAQIMKHNTQALATLASFLKFSWLASLSYTLPAQHTQALHQLMSRFILLPAGHGQAQRCGPG